MPWGGSIHSAFLFSIGFRENIFFFSSRNGDVNCSYHLGKWSQKPAEEWSEVHLWFHSNGLHCVFFPNTPSPLWPGLSDRDCGVIKMVRSVTRLAWSEREWGERERGRYTLCPYQGIETHVPSSGNWQAHTIFCHSFLARAANLFPAFWFPARPHGTPVHLLKSWHALSPPSQCTPKPQIHKTWFSRLPV